MTNISMFRSIAVSSVVLAALAGGCGSSPQVRFYTLNALKASPAREAPASGQNRFTLGVGPVDIPDYLERHQIVTRSGGNEMLLAEYDRWAGSLKQDVARVLIEDLAALLPPGSTVLFWKRNIPMDRRVAVEVTRLDVFPGQSVVLDARWAVFGKDPKTPLALRDRTITEPLTGGDFNAAVSGIGKALGRLSEDIAGDIKAVDTGGRIATAPANP